MSLIYFSLCFLGLISSSVVSGINLSKWLNDQDQTNNLVFGIVSATLSLILAIVAGVII